jgi:AcrR family transcriptional regulator
MKPARKKILHDQQRAEIKAVAWAQITDSGAAALSLGAIARAMQITTPALYRYFPSRDELVSALIEDAYRWFAEALEKARDSADPGDSGAQFRALCLAYRQWALEHPQPYSLLFGSPAPGHPLSAAAGQVADRSFEILLETIRAALQTGRLASTEQTLRLTPALAAQINRLQGSDPAYPAAAVYLALASWSFIHGIVSLELHQRYAILLADQVDEFALAEINRFMRTIGF